MLIQHGHAEIVQRLDVLLVARIRSPEQDDRHEDRKSDLGYEGRYNVKCCLEVHG